jgi:4-hydroxy-tetrahydrodipicolinate synthase
MSFEGTFTAIVTPFRSDGAVDLRALGELVEWQIESRIDGLVPCGSTGESATLSPDEHVSVIRHVVEVAAGRVPVIAGTGSNSTREAVEFTRHARDLGADAALLISPYYNRPTQDGIFLHYRKIAEETGFPLVVYNIPGRTASRIEPETCARLSHVPNVVGLKEAGADLVKTSETIAQCEPSFAVLSGDDALTLPMLALGARGVISTIANVAPHQAASIVRAYLGGDMARARAVHYELLPLMQALFIETNPIPVKTALHILGRIPDPSLRLPLTPLTRASRERLEATLANAKPA